MPKPHLKKKIRYVVGIDEAGRGPLAGPVSVAAVAIPESHYKKALSHFNNARDSKQLSEKVREEIFKAIKNDETFSIRWSVSLVSNTIIDKEGIVPAVKKALRRSLEKLELVADTCEVLLDGSLKAPREYRNQKTIIRGDQTEKIISMASIIAKVHRDRHMVRKSKEYPHYGFEIHKGYGTRDHILKIRKHGPSEIHRKSFLANL